MLNKFRLLYHLLWMKYWAINSECEFKRGLCKSVYDCGRLLYNHCRPWPLPELKPITHKLSA